MRRNYANKLIVVVGSAVVLLCALFALCRVTIGGFGS